MLNKNITLEFIEKYIDKEWDWREISMLPILTKEFIEKYPNKPWDWDGITWNSKLTTELIEKYSGKITNWCHISSKLMNDRNKKIRDEIEMKLK